jgi:DNA ligase-1
LTGKWVLDGETCIMEDDKENFNLLMREVTRKNHTIENPRYCIFDILSIDEFEGKTESQNFENRYNNLLEHYYSSQYEPMVQSRIKILEQELITSQDLFDKWTKSVSDNNWEGFMLRKNAPFKSGRSKDLLKVKKFQDAEYIIEDILTGKVFYNENGMKEYNVVTAVIINHKGTKVQVGSGLSKEQRINWFNNPQEIIGKTATIQYFEETVNKNDDSLSLRFPVLKHVYEDGRKV